MKDYGWAVSLLLIPLGGCVTGTGQINPYLTLTEEFGLGQVTRPEEAVRPGAQGLLLQPEFRRRMTITFQNNNPDAELNVSLAAWVMPGSLRSAQQQDALIADGYEQLARAEPLGTTLTLPVGTFVYDGGGTAGATVIRLPAARIGEGNTLSPTSRVFDLITPDGILAFAQPPVSCDSVAFYYTRDGEPLTAVLVGGHPENPYGGATRSGGFKTFAQVDVYQCEPLRPGVFLRVSGARQTNEYLEGENAAFEFNRDPDANGKFCIVTIGAP